MRDFHHVEVPPLTVKLTRVWDSPSTNTRPSSNDYAGESRYVSSPSQKPRIREIRSGGIQGARKLLKNRTTPNTCNASFPKS